MWKLANQALFFFEILSLFDQKFLEDFFSKILVRYHLLFVISLSEKCCFYLVILCDAVFYYLHSIICKSFLTRLSILDSNYQFSGSGWSEKVMEKLWLQEFPGLLSPIPTNQNFVIIYNKSDISSLLKIFLDKMQGRSYWWGLLMYVMFVMSKNSTLFMSAIFKLTLFLPGTSVRYTNCIFHVVFSKKLWIQ